MTLKELYNARNTVEVGIDEAGRGSLIGDVYVAAVIWNPEVTDGLAEQIKDSKKLSRKKRAVLRSYIEDNAVDYAVAKTDNIRIDTVNIYQATQEAMHAALNKLQVDFDFVLVDGNGFRPYMKEHGDEYVQHACIVGGDNIYMSIAAASILAKEYHDEHIKTLVTEHPYLEKYGLLKNMGYGTKVHLEAIKAFGVTDFHRKSFSVCKIIT